jgi:hypothetical protein
MTSSSCNSGLSSWLFGGLLLPGCLLVTWCRLLPVIPGLPSGYLAVYCYLAVYWLPGVVYPGFPPWLSGVLVIPACLLVTWCRLLPVIPGFPSGYLAV